MTRHSPQYWAIMDTLRAHQYRYDQPTSKPESPGWNSCGCGWEGYWSEFHPHLTAMLLEATGGTDFPGAS